MAPVTTALPKDHVVRFYEDDDFLFDAVGRFLLEGLRQNESVVIIAGEQHRRGFMQILEQFGVNIQEARSCGLLTEVDAEELLRKIMDGDLHYGLPDRALFRKAVGGLIEKASTRAPAVPVRAYGELVDVLLGCGNESAAILLEELWNELRQTYRFRLYCAYSLERFSRSEHRDSFHKICRLHSHVLPAESYDENASLEEQERQIAELQQRARALEAEMAARKRLDDALRQEQERLRAVSRRKDEFFALLSHELRNPLAPILTALDVMDLRGDDQSRHEREIIRRQASHLAGLVEDLLDVSRVTSGKIELRKEQAEIGGIIAKAIEMASPILEERAHILQVSVPGRGLMLEADRIRLPQIVTNLLTNAAKYTPRGGQISISAKRARGMILIMVEDNGIGIAPEALDSLFDPFVQGDRQLERAQGGLGIGLTLVRSFTELHGGTVSAHSEGPGKGSRFVLRLPALPSRESQARRSRRPSTPLSQPASAQNGDRQRVLIVDDNVDGALAFADLIGRLGHEVRVAHDGPQALGIALTFHPSVALVDIGLPVMDGFELAKKLREGAHSHPLRLIAVTGYGQETDREKSAQAGFDVHLVKPIDMQALRAVLPGRDPNRDGEALSDSPQPTASASALTS